MYAEQSLRLAARAALLGLGLLVWGLPSGCGGAGGGSAPPPPPPPPTADFVLRPSSSASLQQAGAAGFVTVSVDSLNGFTTPVSVTVEGLPAGVSVSSALPLQIPPGQSQVFSLVASTTAAVGASSITVRGTAGALTHTATTSLSVTPKAPFHLTLSPSSATLTRGTNTSAQVQLVVDSGSVPQVTLSVPNPLPNLGISFGVSSVVLTPGQSATLSITTVALGEVISGFPIVVTAQQGSDTAVATFVLNVSVPFPSNTAPTRSTMVRTDEPVTGIVYDPARKQVFATVHDLNKVEVFSSVDGHRLATIPVNRPLGIDLSPDGQRVYVGTRSGLIAVIDPQQLRVVQRVFIPDTWPPPSFNSSLPRAEYVAAMANGTVFVLERDDNTTSQELFLWNPTAGTFTDRRVFLQGFSPQAMWRSRDGSKLLVGAGHSAGGFVTLYKTATDSFTPVVSIPSLSKQEQIALNSDGTRVALLTGQEIILYDDQLQEVKHASSASISPQGVLFSRDDRFLYITQQVTTLAAGLTILDAQTLSVLGVLPSLIGDFFGSVPSAADETGMIFAASDIRGLAFVDASSPRALSLKVPQMRLPNTMDPPQGDASSPAPTTVNGVGFIPGAQVFFGAPPASPQASAGTDVSVTSTNVIKVTPPRATTAGPVNVTVLHPDGWYAFALEAYNYGPRVLFVAPGTGPPEGGSTVRIYGSGFAYGANQIQVTIGGQPASVTDVSIFGNTLTFRTPAGAPGPADLTITTPTGGTTVPRGFSYLKRAKVFPVAGQLSQVIYDHARNRLYATNAEKNRVEVFDLATEQFLTPIPVGASPAGLALTPDGARLVVANFRDNTVSVFNPDNPGTPATVTTDVNPQCGPQPTLVAGVKPHHAVIQIGCRNEIAAVFRVLDAATLSFGCGSLPGCSQFLNNFGGGTDVAATPDGAKAFVANGLTSGGGVGIWDLNGGTFLLKATGVGVADAAAAADGNLFVTAFAILGPDLSVRSTPQDVRLLRAAAESLDNLFGEKLHPSGSLFYVPQTTGVDIFDAHRGRLVARIVTAEHITGSIDALALDETGRRIFLTSTSGLAILELNEIPLSIGSLAPEQGPAAGGTLVTIRGSGFQAGAVVKFNDTTAATTFVDENTLRVISPPLPASTVRITIINPDGRQYNLDAGFNYVG